MRSRTASSEWTIVNLLEDEGDASTVADALSDAWWSEYDLKVARLAELLAPNAVRLGQAPGDGIGALTCLMIAAEDDVASQARRPLDQVLESKIPLPGIEAFLEKVISNMPAPAAGLLASRPRL